MDILSKIVLLLLCVYAVFAKYSKATYATDSLVPSKSLYLNKMYVQSQGAMRILVSNLTRSSNTPQAFSNLYLYAIQQQQFQMISSMSHCRHIFQHTRNKVSIRINQWTSFNLTQKRPHLWYFYIVYCPQNTPAYPLDQTIVKIELEVTQNQGHHAQLTDFTQLLTTALQSVLILAAIFLYRKLWSRFTSLLNILAVSYGMSTIFQYFSYQYLDSSGKVSMVLNCVQLAFKIGANMYVLHHLVSVQIGWKVFPKKDDIADLVSAFVICYGVLQLILPIMYMRDNKDIQVSRYADTYYFLIQVLFNVLFYIASAAGIFYAENKLKKSPKKWDVLVYLHGLGLFYLVGAPLCSHFLDLCVLTRTFQILLCLSIVLILDLNFLNPQQAKSKSQ